MKQRSQPFFKIFTKGGFTTFEDKHILSNLILRIEKFNQELREKNLILEEQLQSKKEMEICDEFSNHVSIIEPYSYIS